MLISVLEKQKGLLQILLYLYTHKNEKANVTKLLKNISVSNDTLTAAILYLREQDLIKDEHVKSFPQPHEVWLTQKGVAVGKGLFGIDQVLLGVKLEEKRLYN